MHEQDAALIFPRLPTFEKKTERMGFHLLIYSVNNKLDRIYFLFWGPEIRSKFE